MKNLFILATLTILGFTSCEQVETVEPDYTPNNQVADYSVTPILNKDIKIKSCTNCEFEKEVLNQNN